MIRLMTIKDYDEVYETWLSIPGMGFNNLDDSKEGIEKFLSRNPNTCFVACEDDKIVGGIMCGHDGRRGYIYHTFVREEYRRRGIGDKLVETGMKALETEGIHKVALLVFEKNETGNAFWEKMGFEKRKDVAYRNKFIHEMVRMDT
ncbi:MAG: GNAT family N-acetyltransferase [Lachnospiraceae bacterium]|nr:GNAT family N-acetyltransferase [Lachnospiraceae bacterium]